MSIAQFIPVYPTPGPGFSYEIARRKEFQELSLSSSEPVPESQGIPLLSQEIVARFFSPQTDYRSGLLYHGMGTGKCVLPGTLITTATGEIPIEKLQDPSSTEVWDGEGLWSSVDVMVLSSELSQEKASKFYRQVVSEEITCLTFHDGTELRKTKAHHLLGEKGWQRTFSRGDFVYTSTAPLQVTKIKNEWYTGWVYDLEVRPNHTYLANGIISHNTCTSSLIIEHAKAFIERPALIIVPNQDLKRNYRREVAEQCTEKGTYEPLLTLDEQRKMEKGEGVEMSKMTREHRLKVAVSRTYEIVTYETFLSSLSSDQETKKKYSDRVIILDEAHNLRIQPRKKKKATISQMVHDIEPGMSIALYNKMHHFLHVVENCRIILLTGTPIWDRAFEIASLMNLILPTKEQLPTTTKFIKKFFDGGELRAKTLPELEKAFRGRVSFLRPMITSAHREEIGVKEPWLHLINVYPSAMSQFQEEYADKALNDSRIVKKKLSTTKTVEREIKGGVFRFLARDASTFVFPVFKEVKGKVRVVGGEYGTKAFSKNIIFKGSYRYRDKNTQVELQRNLARYSSKFAAILEHITSRPDELVFIYDEFVSSGGGAINLALILQLHGYHWAKNAEGISRPGNKRFAVITSKTGTTNDPKQIETLLNSFNQPDNSHGERCQILIGSKKVGEGLTIKNVRQVHIVTPHWNVSAIDQALGRVFRVNSHSGLAPEERYIRIYRHIAAQEAEEGEGFDEGAGFPASASFSDKITMDLEVYRMAENKERYNAQIRRFLKRIAWDCPLTYRRNVLETDQDDTRECDYEECNYECSDFPFGKVRRDGVWDYSIPEDDLVYDTKDLFYSREDIAKLKREIASVMSLYFVLDLEMIGRLLDTDNRLLLLMALDEVIYSRIPIRDRYGFTRYLREEGNVYFLTDGIEDEPERSEVEYIQYPLVFQETPFDDLVEIWRLKKDKSLLEKWCQAPSAKILDRLDPPVLAMLVEKAHELKVSGKKLNQKERSKVDMLSKKLFQVDGKVAHSLNGTRVFDNGWKSLEKEKLQPATTWEGNQYGVYAFRDKTGKFKIRTKPLPGRRETKGAACMEAAWPMNRIFELFEHIEYLPRADKKYKKYTRKRLLKEITAQPKLSVFDTQKMSDDDLRKVLTMHSMNKKELCSSLEEWFRKNNLYHEL